MNNSIFLFMHRLKFEFRENLKLISVYWLMLGVLLWSFLYWWQNPHAGDMGLYSFFWGMVWLAMLAMIQLVVIVVFKRDDLKCSRAFWATKPIRAKTLYLSKSVLVLVGVIVPLAVATAVAGSLTGMGGFIKWQVAEVLLWILLSCVIIALSTISFAGIWKVPIQAALFIGGLIVASFLIESDTLASILEAEEFVLGDALDDEFVVWNMLVGLAVLLVIYTWFGVSQITDKHRMPKLVTPWLIGMSFIFVIFSVPIPIKKQTRAFLDKHDIVGSYNEHSQEADPLKLNEDQAKVELLMVSGASYAHFAVRLSDELSYEDVIGIYGLVDVDGDVDKDRFGVFFLWINDETKEMWRYGEILKDRQFADGAYLWIRVNLCKLCHADSDLPVEFSELANRISSLPSETYKFTGDMHIQTQRWDELHRGSLDEEFVVNHMGRRLAYQPTKMGEQRGERLLGTVLRRKLDWPLITADLEPDYRLIIQDPGNEMNVDVMNADNELAPDFPSLMWYVEKSRSYSLFGRSHTSALQIPAPTRKPDVPIAVSWGRDKKLDAQWKSQSELVFETRNNDLTYTRSLEVDVKLPNLEKLEDLLHEVHQIH